MNDDIVGDKYSNSNECLRVGDKVLVDNHPGEIVYIFRRGSKEAEGCYCEDTGAVEVKFDDGYSALLPFGNQTRIEKRDGYLGKNKSRT